MRARSRTGGLVVIAIMLSSAVPIALLASPTATAVTTLVVVAGILIGLLTQGLLNRRTTGRFRIAWRRRPAYLVPADLPPPPGLLVGRESELARICGLLGPDRPTGEHPPVVVVTGEEGVGKTALAVTAAHIVAPHFADGQILVRFDTQRPDGDDYARMYLARALSAASAPAPAEADFDRWYRRQTAHRQLLVVLDNVADSVDVRRFLPVGRRCAAIVTSRSPVRGLDGATLDGSTSEALPPLTDPAAADLLKALLGAAADGIDPRHVERIVTAADGYPAALQMAGAVLRTRRSWDLDVAFGEADALRIAPSDDGGPAFLGVLNLACALLTDQERRCLALLSLLDTRRAAPWMLSALAGGAFPEWAEFDEITAARILDRLTRVRFAEVRVEERSGVTVYRVPGYVKAYARRLLPSEVDEDGVARALTAFGEVYRARLERSPERAARLAVYHLLDLGRLDEALAGARENLHLAQVRRKAATEPDLETAFADERLAEVALAEVFAELGWIDDALAYAVAAERSALASTRMRSLRVQGRLRWRLRQSTAAIEKLTAARRIAEVQFPLDLAERIRVLRELTVAYTLAGEVPAALEAGELAVRLCDQAPSLGRRRPGALWAYGVALTAAGNLAEAETILNQADALSGTEGLEQGLWRPWIRYQRAEVALDRQEYDAARSLAASALKGFTALIHRYGSGHCRQLLGRAYFLEGAFDRAVPILEEALQTFERCGDRWIEADTAYWLGRAYAAVDGRAEDALSMVEAALTVFERLKDPAAVTRTQAALRELEGNRPPWLARRTGLPLPDAPRMLT